MSCFGSLLCKASCNLITPSPTPQPQPSPHHTHPATVVNVPTHLGQTHIVPATQAEPLSGMNRRKSMKSISQRCILLSSGWDNNLNGGKLCLYHKAGGKDSKAGGKDSGNCGEQVTLVAPAGDTVVVFDSHMEHEVMPSFADR